MWNPFRLLVASVQPKPPESPPAEQPAPVSVAVAAAPLVIGDGQNPVLYARYRLDAIRRHIEQRLSIAPGKMAEFREETYSLIHRLHAETRALRETRPDAPPFLTPEQERLALQRVGVTGPVEVTG